MIEKISKAVVIIIVNFRRAIKAARCFDFATKKLGETFEHENLARRLSVAQDLQKEAGGWANKTFGKSQTVTGVINHLVKEVYELKDSNEPEEAADCLLLLFQLAHEGGYDLIQEAQKKHKINLKRKWGKPDKYGVIEHIRER